MSETADNPDAEALQQAEQSGAIPPAIVAAMQEDHASAGHPVLPDDHPLSYLGGEYRVLAGYIADLEARLKKLEGG